MALSDCIAWIATTLGTLANHGAIHQYEPVATQASAIPAVFGGSHAVKAWSITTEATEETPRTNIEVVRMHHFVIRLYVEVGDPAITESATLVLSEAAMTAFRATYQLDPPSNAEIVWPMQRRKFGHVLLGQTLLCHYAEHTLRMQELIRL